jgi:hypothetical protein
MYLTNITHLELNHYISIDWLVSLANYPAVFHKKLMENNFYFVSNGKWNYLFSFRNSKIRLIKHI